MQIYKYDVPNELIAQYCRIIDAMEAGFTPELERERSNIHVEIFNSVGCSRAGVTRDDRRFASALSNTICDLMM